MALFAFLVLDALGQRYPDKKIPYELNPYMVPTCESERVPGWGSRDSTRLPGWGSRESTRLPGWGSRPHSNRRNSTSFRSAPENVVLVSDRGMPILLYGLLC